ncbi:hypothetical protein BGZ82_001538, partial [Podila clonocystis]
PEMDSIILDYWEQAKDKPKPKWTTRLDQEKKWISDIAKMHCEDDSDSRDATAEHISPADTGAEDTVPDGHNSDYSESSSSDASKVSGSHAKYQPRPRPLRHVLRQYNVNTVSKHDSSSSSKNNSGSTSSSHKQPSASAPSTGGSKSVTSSTGDAKSGTSSTGIAGPDPSSTGGAKLCTLSAGGTGPDPSSTGGAKSGTSSTGSAKLGPSSAGSAKLGTSSAGSAKSGSSSIGSAMSGSSSIGSAMSGSSSAGSVKSGTSSIGSAKSGSSSAGGPSPLSFSTQPGTHVFGGAYPKIHPHAALPTHHAMSTAVFPPIPRSQAYANRSALIHSGTRAGATSSSYHVRGPLWVPYKYAVFATIEEGLELIYEYARQTGFKIRNRGGDGKGGGDGKSNQGTACFCYDLRSRLGE